MFADKMDKFIHIKSDRFLPLPDEENEMVNEGMYGKALSVFLQEQLKKLGYDAPFYCCEDWGWWIELKGFPFTFGVCIYSSDRNEEIMEYAVTDGALTKKKWSWKKFGFIETEFYSEKLFHDLQAIVEKNDGMEMIGISDDFPIDKS
jgi:hypothetical protein